MNKQNPPNGIEWTRVVLKSGEVLPGYTWNPMSGCHHGCEWDMPDGTRVECYAKTVAERVAGAAYPQGFAYAYNHAGKRLAEPMRKRERSGIFILSMGDLMGSWVSDEQVQAVLDVCEQTDHIYFILTKNPARLIRFRYPANVWVGASLPPTLMNGQAVAREKMLRLSLRSLAETNAKIRWLSLEPLSWDCSDILNEYTGVIQWAVVGAASHGKTYFPPSLSDFQAVQGALDSQGAKTFYKGNMRSLEGIEWREEFPDVE